MRAAELEREAVLGLNVSRTPGVMVGICGDVPLLCGDVPLLCKTLR